MSIVTLATRATQESFADSAFALLLSAYSTVPGGLHFNNAEELCSKCCRFDLIMIDQQLAAVVVYKAKHGLKISAFGYDRTLGETAREALRALLTKRLQHAWIEVSDRAENFVLNQCQGRDLIIANHFAPQLLDAQIEADVDGLHYRREILGHTKRKIMVGTHEMGQTT